jgi:hypothetical protein
MEHVYEIVEDFLLQKSTGAFGVGNKVHETE